MPITPPITIYRLHLQAVRKIFTNSVTAVTWYLLVFHDYRICVNMNLLKCNFSFAAAHVCITSSPVTPRPALRKARNSLRLDKEVKISFKDTTPLVEPSASPVRDDKTEGNVKA